MYPSPSSDKFTTYPKYLLHKICENVESLAKSDELSKSNFLKGIQEVKKEGEERRGEGSVCTLIIEAALEFFFSFLCST